MISNEAYRAAFEFHKKWSPYPVTAADWEKCCDDMCQVSNSHGNNKLLMDLLVAVFNDLETEWKEAKKRGEVKDDFDEYYEATKAG